MLLPEGQNFAVGLKFIPFLLKENISKPPIFQSVTDNFPLGSSAHNMKPFLEDQSVRYLLL